VPIWGLYRVYIVNIFIGEAKWTPLKRRKFCPFTVKTPEMARNLRKKISFYALKK